MFCQIQLLLHADVYSVDKGVHSYLHTNRARVNEHKMQHSLYLLSVCFKLKIYHIIFLFNTDE